MKKSLKVTGVVAAAALLVLSRLFSKETPLLAPKVDIENDANYKKIRLTYQGAGHVTRSAEPSSCPDAQMCTRQVPHVCAENGPCNGFPKEEGANPSMRLKHF